MRSEMRKIPVSAQSQFEPAGDRPMSDVTCRACKRQVEEGGRGERGQLMHLDQSDEEEQRRTGLVSIEDV